jgi:(1->4)-alpha-D-glucan 1-alpha-D-glucosylmutase
MLKAAREAKRNTSWLDPNEPYESGSRSFIEKILDPALSSRFLADFRAFASEVEYFGRFNSLAQTLLKITSPGAPDFYQGSELWDLSLVDPDNRRRVDFDVRSGLLDRFRESRPAGPRCAELLDEPSGAAKLFLIWSALQCRNSNRELFDQGAYERLAIVSPKILQRHLCAFARVVDEKIAVVLVPRFVRTLVGDRRILPCSAVWEDAEVVLPAAYSAARLANPITGAEVRARSCRLRVAELLADFPVALLAGCS